VVDLVFSTFAEVLESVFGVCKFGYDGNSSFLVLYWANTTLRDKATATIPRINGADLLLFI
jgi:hypothetical protein